jgi:hypothetical protein
MRAKGRGSGACNGVVSYWNAGGKSNSQT